jgi:hypothetical protein
MLLRVSVWDVRCVGCWRALFWGDKRHDTDVPLCSVGLVASCVSARVCAWCDGAALVGMCVSVGPAEM